MLFLVLALAGLVVCESARADDAGRWSFDLQSGNAYSFHVPLELSQGSYEKRLTAHYSTRPFGGGAAPYYGLRLRRTISADEYLGFEVLHHKLWLDNRPPEVAEFRMTFGYNPLFFSYGRKVLEWLHVYAGTGPIVAHPENTVNGLKLPDKPKVWPLGHRYKFVGFGGEIGTEAFWYFTESFFLNSDLKLTYSYSWAIPLVGGTAKTQQASLHYHLGVGYSW